MTFESDERQSSDSDEKRDSDQSETIERMCDVDHTPPFDDYRPQFF